MISVFLHVDLNSYFASAEQQDHPEWRGKPVGVCEHLGGIIIAASIEAKRWGISTGTPVWEARKLYPKIILTKTHPDRYRMYSDRLMKILGDYTAHVEQYSIDEAFLDVTRVCNVVCYSEGVHPTEKSLKSTLKGSFRSLSCIRSVGMTPEMVDPFVEAARIAALIKLRMKAEVGDWLRCSVGIAENKLLAKIGSDMQKPDGLVIIRSGDAAVGTIHPDERAAKAGPCKGTILVFLKHELYDRLTLTDIPGIGKRQEKRLNELGIKTLVHLRDYPKSKLVAQFGILGHHLWEMGQLNSSWKPKVEQEDDIKSIGHMYTLPKEYREKKFFIPVLYKLSEMVARRMRAQKLTGNVLHFYIHDEHYEGYGKSKKLGYYIQDGREIFYESMKIFDQTVGAGFTKPRQFKLIGVTISSLTEHNGQQSLFKKDEYLQRVVESLDKINEKYGDFTICRVPVRLAGNVFRDSIGFGRIKEHVRLASFR